MFLKVRILPHICLETIRIEGGRCFWNLNNKINNRSTVIISCLWCNFMWKILNFWHFIYNHYKVFCHLHHFHYNLCNILFSAIFNVIVLKCVFSLVKWPMYVLIAGMNQLLKYQNTLFFVGVSFNLFLFAFCDQ